MLTNLLQMVVNGIAAGSSYALMGLAIVFIYKTSEVVNFAQGEMALISSYFTFALLNDHGISMYIAFPAAFIFSFLLGVFIEFAIIRRAKNPSVLNILMISLGLNLILFGLVSWKFGSEQQALPFPISVYDSLEVKGILISTLDMLSFIFSIVLMLFFYLFFRFSKFGMMVKATQQNEIAARLMGVRTKNIIMIIWGLSSLIGCVAGLLISLVTMQPSMMLLPMLKGLVAAVLGGLTSFPGVILGAYILGIIENLFGGLVNIEFKSIVAFFIVVIVLCIKPSGIFTYNYIKKK